MCFRDVDRVVINGQAGGPFECQRAPARARCHDHRLAGKQLSGNSFAERLRAECRANNIDEFGLIQRTVDVVAGVSDVTEPGYIAFSEDAALFRNRGNIARKLREIEKPDPVSMRSAVKRNAGPACSGTQNGDVH
jgi:hypothetical protein